MLQDITTTADNIRNITSKDSLPAPPCSPAPAVPASSTPGNGNATRRRARSLVWFHFKKAVDYPTSRKVTCLYCDKTFTATGGTTTTLHSHLSNKHPDVLKTSDKLLYR